MSETIDERLKFLDKISNFEPNLYQPGIEDKFGDDQKKQQFKLDRLHFSLFVQRVQLNIGNILVEQLEQNAKAFEDGIANLQQEIASINNAVAFLDLFGRVLGVIGKIVGLGV